MLKKDFCKQFCEEDPAINRCSFSNRKSETKKILELNREYTCQEGFLCTSLKKNSALSFAEVLKRKDSQIQNDFISVLLKIELKRNKNFFINDEYTHAFPDEQEGLKFKIVDKTK